MHGLSATDAYEKINVQLGGDGDTNFDLGSFTSTQMPKQCEQLYLENLDKNLVNVNEYPESLYIESYLAHSIAELLNAPDLHAIYGKSTAGSSEAIAMAMLMHKYSWIKKTGNNSSQQTPNIVFGSDIHLSWHRFAKYFSIEVREIPLLENNIYPFNDVIDNVDENTICIVANVGSTYTGSCDPIDKLNQSLKVINKQYGYDVGIHIDAAVGGFVLPFLKTPDDYHWDFRSDLVRSINLSSHKFGMVYPGLGWLIVRNKTLVDNSLLLDYNYLCGNSQSFSLNFSRPVAPVIAQYYLFLHLGFVGYQRVIGQCQDIAIFLRDKLEATGLFFVISEMKIPVLAFQFANSPPFNEEVFVNALKNTGWMLPCYQLKTPSKPYVMRIVVRHTATKQMYLQLIDDLVNTYCALLKKLETVSGA